MSDVIKYYRYIDGHDCPLLIEYELVKTTQCGVWVESLGYKRFILNGTTKRFAHTTIEAAKKSYIARKQKHIKILENQLIKVNKNLTAILTGKTETEFNFLIND